MYWYYTIIEPNRRERICVVLGFETRIGKIIMTKKEWENLKIDDKVIYFNKIYTINRFSFGCKQAEIISENGHKTWVGRTSIEYAEQKTNKFTDETLMPFGKYKGEKLINVPASYLLWLYTSKRGSRNFK